MSVDDDAINYNEDQTCFVCQKCQSYLSQTSYSSSFNTKVAQSVLDQEGGSKKEPAARICSVCMGLWDATLSSQWLQKAIEQACEPYGGIASNRFCTLPNHGPTLSICGDVYLRYKRHSSSPASSSAIPYSVYLQELKQALYTRIEKILESSSTKNSNNESSPPHPPILSNSEQQGYLSMHILCLPPKGQSLLDHHGTSSINNNKKRKRSRQQHKGPFTTQGGDPRVSLERRLEAQGYQWWTLAEAEAETNTVASMTTPTTTTATTTTPPMECHAAIFRRPIFLYGYYTKSRRDVSQTPFVVVDKKEPRQEDQERRNTNTIDEEEAFKATPNTTTTTTTLGVTSVEEEICRPIIQLLGISTQNNLPPPVESSNKSSTGGGVQYGMCKFHASGREDMDVRMLLRPNMGSNNRGRPFCVQVIDALQPLQSLQQLDDLVTQVNVGDGPSNPLWYGANPMGVGVAPNLKLVPACAFSGLQADTEHKVKHYGCHCWSEQELPSDWTFDLATATASSTSHAPGLTIQQRTPLRVLHRRSNIVRERQILAAQGRRIDAHHFRLELTTQAGTYVKEFVHGDLRRTTPSMATLMGTKTNILLLDCEGIQMGDDDDADGKSHGG